MPRIKNTDEYPIKATPVAADWVIGSDSENNGATVAFEIGSFIGEESTVTDNNKGKEVNFGFASAGSNAAVADAINSIATPVTVLYDEYPMFIGIVPDSVIPAISYRNVYVLAGKGKGSYGVGGSVTVLSADLILISSSQSTIDPVGNDPAAVLENLGEIGSATISATMNVASPAILLNSGENLYLEVTRSGDRYVYGFTGAPAVYGLGQTQTVDGDFFLIYSEGTIVTDLQAVLDANGYAETADAAGYFSLALAEGGNSSFEWQSTSGTSFIGMYSDATVWRMLSSNSVGGRESQFRVSGGMLDFYQEVAAGTTSVNFIDPIANTTLRYPAKTLGTYTLATTSDVNINSMWTADGEDFELTDGNNYWYLSHAGVGGYHQNFMMNGAERSDYNQDQNNIRLSVFDTTVGNGDAGLLIEAAGVARNLTFYEKLNSFQTTVGFTTPTADSTLSFPAKAAGSYVLATIPDIYDWSITDTFGVTTFYADEYNYGADLTFGTVNFRATDANNRSELNLEPFSVFLKSTNTDGIAYSEFLQTGGDVRIRQYQTPTAYTDVEFTTPTGQVTLNFPAKATGTYTLATTADITLQQIVDNNALSVFSGDSLAGLDALIANDGGGSFFNFTVQETGAGKSYLYLDAYAASFQQFGSDLVKYGWLNIADGDLSLRQRITGSLQTTVEFITPTNVSTLQFPAPAVAGTYEVGLRDKAYTVATLPTGAVGDRAYVTDATAPTYLAALTGGGGVTCPVFHNGTIWVSA